MASSAPGLDVEPNVADNRLKSRCLLGLSQEGEGDFEYAFLQLSMVA